MAHSIHTLELRKTITAPGADGTLEIREFRSLVGRGNLEPDPKDHLAELEGIDGGDPSASRAIQPGTYLFTQVPYPDAAEDRIPAYRSAAEAIWLEALWRGVSLKNDRILVRTLSEDGKTVFQVFREIAPNP